MAGVADPLLQIQITALNKRLDEFERISLERLANVKENVSNALAAADKAVTKAEMASEKRFESVNEFRAALSDQNGSFVRQSEYSLSHNSLISKVDLISSQVITIETTLRNKIASSLTGPALFGSMGGVIILLIVSIITGAIKLGIDQNQIDNIKSLVDHLVEQERNQDKETSRLNVLTETIKTRQTINEDRLKRLEK